MIPASWPAGKYWTADKKWVDIANHLTFGTSADGTEQYHYVALIAGLPDEVEAVSPFETEDRFFASPMGPVSLAEARQTCQDRGGELPGTSRQAPVPRPQPPSFELETITEASQPTPVEVFWLYSWRVVGPL